MRHRLLAAAVLALATAGLQAQSVTGRGDAAGSDSVGTPRGTAGGTTGQPPPASGDAPAAGRSGQPGPLAPVQPMATQPQSYSGMADSARWERTHRLSRVLGREVRNREGERIGRIEDVVLDAGGNAAYAIVSTGGFLGLGDRLHAVPWRLLETHNADYHLLDMNRERLRQAPGFDSRAWPNFTDERWNAENLRFYGVKR